jgi:hypothetical protein
LSTDSFGQYIRSTISIGPFGAGSQYKLADDGA